MAITIQSSVTALTLAAILWLALTMSAAQARPELTPAKLDAFVTAAIAADQVLEHWTSRIYGAGSEAEAAQLREQADEAMGTAIDQTNGMTLEDYRLIYGAAQDDPALAARLIELYQKRAGQ